MSITYGTSLASPPSGSVVSTAPGDGGTIQAIQVVDASTLSFKGSVMSFRTPGRAGTAGQKILALHNATGSSRVVRINKVVVDVTATVIKAVTVLPPVVRLWKFTTIPTNGTSLSKASRDSNLTSNASVTVWGDASADGTGSGTTLTVTLPAGNIITEEFAPRLITAAGYEISDRIEFLLGEEDCTLRALEGVCVFLDYVLATQNPTTDMWLAGIHFTEGSA